MLDNYSQGTLVKEDILKKLQIDGRKTLISIKTLNDENTFQLHAIDGLQVRNFTTKSKNIWLNLPTTYPQNQLPADTNKVVSTKKHKKCKYLKTILTEISERDDIQMDFLIGPVSRHWNQSRSYQTQHKVPMLTRLCLDGVVCPKGVNKANLKE